MCRRSKGSYFLFRKNTGVGINFHCFLLILFRRISPLAFSTEFYETFKKAKNFCRTPAGSCFCFICFSAQTCKMFLFRSRDIMRSLKITFFKIVPEIHSFVSINFHDGTNSIIFQIVRVSLLEAAVFLRELQP